MYFYIFFPPVLLKHIYTHHVSFNFPFIGFFFGVFLLLFGTKCYESLVIILLL